MLRKLLTCALLVGLASCAPKGGEEAASPPSAEAPPPATPAAPAPVAAPASADAAAPPATSLASVSALGAPTAARAASLEGVKWAQDGGGPDAIEPAAGSTLVVVTFPEATKVTYASTEVSLVPEGGGEPIVPLAVTSPTANPVQPRSADPGPARFQRSVYMFVDWEPGPNTPFAIAFEVPASATSGVLRVAGAETPIRW